MFSLDSLKVIIGIYKFTNKVTGKIYIGKTNNVFSRLGQHLVNNCSNAYLQIDFKNYGLNNFSFEVIEEVTELEKLSEREQYYINYYKNLGYTLYNSNSFLIEKGYIVDK